MAINLWRGIKNSWKKAGEKKEQKKETKKYQKANKPAGLRARQAGRVVFWIIAAFMFFVIVANYVIPSDENQAAENTKDEKNMAMSQEATQYGERFLNEYFTWEASNNGMDQRASRLKPFLAVSMDAQAGLQTVDLNKGSSVNQIEFVGADEISNTRALLTYHVDATFSGGDNNNSDADFKQYVAVPVAFENNTYGIYGNPQFKNVSYQTDVQGNIPENLTSYQGDKQAIRQFLETFFNAYSDNEKGTLSYLTTSDSNIKPLDANMSFTKLSNVEVKQNERGDMIALVDVTFTENSGVSFSSSFSVGLEMQENQFSVITLNKY